MECRHGNRNECPYCKECEDEDDAVFGEFSGESAHSGNIIYR